MCREKQSTVPTTDEIPLILLNEQFDLPQQVTDSATFPNVLTSVEGEHNHEVLDANTSQFENTALPFSETTLPENEQSFQFQEEHLQNISLKDDTQTFKKKGLHFVHLNCNILLSKIEEN